MNFSRYFNDPAFSDVLLHVKVAEDRTGPKRSAIHEERAYFVTKLVLGHAEFFQSMLLRWTPSRREGAVASSNLLELELSMAADALPAFELLLLLMYGAALPEAAAGDAMLMVKAYTAADLYGVQPRCADVLAAGLCRLAEGAAAGSFDLDLLLSLYGLPEGRAHLAPLLAMCQARVVELLLGDDVQQCEALAATLCRRPTEDLTLNLVGRLMDPDHDDAAAAARAAAPHMAPLMAKCVQRVMQLFDDVPATITSTELQQQFRSLPYAAVLAWLKEDDLKVHSENCVVLLLWMWWVSNHNNVLAQQLNELACHVRVLHVSQLYLQYVLPRLDWFSSQWKHLQTITAAKLSGAKPKPSADWDFPPAWSADPRKRTGMSDLSLDWDIYQSQLLDRLRRAPAEDDAVMISPKKLYINGAFCNLAADVKKATGDEEPTMGLYLKLCRKQPLLDFPCICVLSAELSYKPERVQEWTIKQLDKTVTQNGWAGCTGIENMLLLGQVSVRATNITLE